MGLKLPNSYGLRDMHGNMNEWCQDFYDDKSYEQYSPDNPAGPSAGSHHVIRGGSWKHNASSSRKRGPLHQHAIVPVTATTSGFA